MADVCSVADRSSTTDRETADAFGPDQPWTQKQASTDAVRSRMGVTGVSDQIGIKHKPMASIVKADIDAPINRSAALDSSEIYVEVGGTDVTLIGKVHSWSERGRATESAWTRPGVRNVIDKMTLSY